MGEPSLSQLRHYRGLMAKVVQNHGDRFWPLFEKLDRECEAHERRRRRLAEAMEAASTLCEPVPHSSSPHDARHEVVGERQSNL